MADELAIKVKNNDIVTNERCLELEDYYEGIEEALDDYREKLDELHQENSE